MARKGLVPCKLQFNWILLYMWLSLIYYTQLNYVNVMFQSFILFITIQISLDIARCHVANLNIRNILKGLILFTAQN